MKSFKLFITMVSICSFGWSSNAIPASVGFIPENVREPEEIAAYFAWVKKSIPNLYTGASKDHPIDYWEIVRENFMVQRMLQKDPNYKKYIEEKKSLKTFTITTPPQPQGNAYDLDALKSDAEKTSAQFSSTEAITEQIQKQEAFLGQKKSQSILSGLIATIPKEQKAALKGDFSIESILTQFSANGGIPESFKGDPYGLSKNPTPAEVLEQYEKLKSAELEVQNLKLVRYYRENPDTFHSQDVESIAKKIEDDAKESGFKSALTQYKLTSAPASALSQTHIEIREMPISLGLFRGCVGGECSTSNAARFITLPTEKVFYIYNPKFPDDPKGYFLMSFLEDKDGKKVAYQKGINGARISSEDTEAILSKTKEIAKSFGAEEVLMPSNGALFNYGAIRSVFTLHTQMDDPVDLTYPDENLRKLIHPADTHYCDAMSKNCQGFRFKEDFAESTKRLKMEIKEVPAPKISLEPPSEIDKFEAALKVNVTSNQEGIATSIYEELGVSPSDMQNFKASLDRHSGTVAELSEKLNRFARTKMGPLDQAQVEERFQYLVDGALIKCSDGFSPAYEQKTSEAYFRKLKKDISASGVPAEFKDYPVSSFKRRLSALVKEANTKEQWQAANAAFSQLDIEKQIKSDPDFLNSFYDILSSKPEALKNVTMRSQEFSAISAVFDRVFQADPNKILLMNQKIADVLSHAKSTSDLKFASNMLSVLKPEQIDPETSEQMIDDLVKHQKIILDPAITEPALKLKSITDSGFPDLANQLFAKDKDRILALVKTCQPDWKLGYYINFKAAIRDTFPEFKGSALWNLKTEGQYRSWLDWVDAREIHKVILAGDYSILGQFPADAKKKIFDRMNLFCIKNVTPECAAFKENFNAFLRDGEKADHAKIEQCFIDTIQKAFP